MKQKTPYLSPLAWPLSLDAEEIICTSALEGVNADDLTENEW